MELTAQNGVPYILGRMRRTRHMSLVLGTLMVLLWTPSLRADTQLGVRLPARSTQLEDGRWQVRGSYEGAVRHISQLLLRGNVRHERSRRIHRASVKYTHFESVDPSTAWRHINVAAYEDGVFVRIFGRESFNGRTTDSDSVDLGSNPSSRTMPR
jgi:hypothetical protein